jgi:glyceraldehyde-3-phosphate dehydrogenase/erythrose-4-phosphate dehydrogenase
LSTDIVRSPYSSILTPASPRSSTAQVKVVSWYTKRVGYSNRLVELAQRVLVPVAAVA